MAIQRRYPDEEFRRLTELIHPEERRYEFTNQPWSGEGFRHYRDPKIVCIEHFRPKPKLSNPPQSGHKPAA